MQPKNELITFFEKSWTTKAQGFDKETLKQFEDGIHSFLIGSTQENEVQSTLSVIFQTVSIGSQVEIEMDSERNKHLNCPFILHKPNKEIIPVYILGDDLNDPEINWGLLVAASEKEGWKFALASNLKVWKVYGLDTSSEEPTQISYEFFKRDNLKKVPKKELKTLTRTLLILIDFELNNNYNWDFTDIDYGMTYEEGESEKNLNDEKFTHAMSGSYGIDEMLEDIPLCPKETIQVELENFEKTLDLIKGMPEMGSVYEDFAKYKEKLLYQLKYYSSP